MKVFEHKHSQTGNDIGKQLLQCFSVVDRRQRVDVMGEIDPDCADVTRDIWADLPSSTLS